MLRQLARVGAAVSTCRAAFVLPAVSPLRAASAMFSTQEAGAPNSLDYRIYFKNASGPISPMHDIPLIANSANNSYNLVVEVPRWTNAKMEICLKEPLNPIKQDVKKGNLRFVANCFPHHGYIWNYGALPQTWENPSHIDSHTQCKGDNDPIDALEIGSRVAKRGDVLQVKILGTLALIDEGETDWKLIVIDVNDPLASQMSDIGDVEKYFPGLLKASVEWFKIYKIPDGKPENQFAFNGEAKNAEFANKIIAEVHDQWKTLINKEVEVENICCKNVTVADSPFKISSSEANTVLSASAPTAPALPIESIVDKIYFCEQSVASINDSLNQEATKQIEKRKLDYLGLVAADENFIDNEINEYVEKRKKIL